MAICLVSFWILIDSPTRINEMLGFFLFFNLKKKSLDTIFFFYIKFTLN